MLTSNGVETTQPQQQNNQTAPNMPTEPSYAEASEDKQVLAEILENTRKTKNYMKWSLYITIVLVVLPLLAALFIVPFAMQSLSSSYGSLLQ